MRLTRLIRVLAVALGLFAYEPFFPGTCLAQSTEPSETIRIDSDLVDLKVSVVRLNPSITIPSLQQKDFVVLEDGKPQDIVFFAGEDTPFDLVLLLDLSGSTADKIKLIRDSTKRFIESTRLMDRIGVYTFSEITLMVSPLTADRTSLKKALKGIEKPVGGTNFWDSLSYVVTSGFPQQKDLRRKAVVVMTDGVDNALPDVFGEGSSTSFEELLDKVTNSDTIVFPIYLDTEKQSTKRNRVPESAYATARTQLAQLAETCGTKLYRANKLSDLDLVYDQVIKDLAMVYSLGYKPKNQSRDGQWRSVVVQLVDHPDLLARARRGYFAPAQP
jgi:Ca-activated chloride channel family protein